MLPYLFYHEHLERVSRSFSFCIRQLDSPLREWIALAYLLLRITDTIEDASWEEERAQLQAFAQFKLFLTSLPDARSLVTWAATFSRLSVAEKGLLEALPSLLNELQTLPFDIQQHLLNTISQMVDGMIYFIQHHKVHDQLHLATLEQVDEYCFVVAGIVGELLTYMVAYCTPQFKITPVLTNQAVHFGLFLQKVNVLKDKNEDELAGRFLVPSYQALRDSLVLDAGFAMDYIKAIPLKAKGYRLFCSWSLFIGLASLKWIDKNWHAQTNYKISRKETTALIFKVQQWVDNNYELERLYATYLS